MDKTFDATSAEARISAAWEAIGAFRAGANASRDATFCVMIPPPNVTGSLHMGHAFNNTLQDILVRWHRMRGFDTLWQPGQDHAGIATQMVVERELARAQQPSRREMGREAFLEKVWAWKETSGDTILRQLKRLGASCDWDRNAFTMDPGFQEAIIKVFVDLYDRGFITRGKRLVNWDPHFETAISDLEVENVETPGHMWHFKYRLADGETYEYVETDADGAVTLCETRDWIAIATTRPETMLGDGAVAVHPSDARYAPIVGRMVHLPLCDRVIPIIVDEYPDPAFGSGAVKITGAHDFNDYQVARRAGLPMYRLMDTKGALRDDGAPYGEAVEAARAIAAGAEATDKEIDALNLVPEKYRGLDRFEARRAVVADIIAAGLAVTDAEGEPVVESRPIMQPHGDRSKVVIEPMLTDQWFVDTSKIVQPAIDAVRNGDTRIYPERDEKTYFHWLENIEPWCISRQLWWGHQIPVWYGPSKEELEATLDRRPSPQGGYGATMHNTRAPKIFCAISEEEAIRQAVKYYGPRVEVTAENDGQAAMRYGVRPGGAFPGNELYVELDRDPDVLDTWFSSGLWPIGTLGWPQDTAELQRYFPTSVLVTGFDIIFFWVARMMMMQLAVVGQVPFHAVYVHALVRDEKGKKMSKSLGNVLDPLDLIDEFGADAVRFTLTAMAAMGRDLKLSTARIAGYRNFGTKIWNAARFAEMNGVWEGHATGPAPQPTATVNRWIIGETAKVREAVDDALDAYRFNDAANALYAFAWGRVCDWYVEFAKPLLADPATAGETRATMAWVLDQCLILLHPIMPFITEELWGSTGARARMLVHSDWPTYVAADLVNDAADREMNWVIAVIDEIRSARAQMHVPVGLHLPVIATHLDATARAAWARNEALIRRLARVEALAEGSAPKGSVTVAVEGATFALPLEGVIDIAAEKERLEKTLQKLGKDVGGLRGRLSNPRFAQSAPEDVVEETREKLAVGEDEIAKLSSALARLAEVD